MNFLKPSLLAATLLTASAVAHGQNLQAALSQLDAASAHFHNAQADVKYDNYTAVVQDHQLQTGTLFVERNGRNESMGAVFFDPGSKSPARIVNYGGGQLKLYTPGTNQEDLFNAGANQAKYQSFLTLGFGGSGKELNANWNITDKGSQTVNGVKAEELDLVSKDPSVRNMFTHVTIWVDLSRGLSVRQIFFQPDGDTRTADYTNIRENSSINRQPYEIPKGAQVIRH